MKNVLPLLVLLFITSTLLAQKPKKKGPDAVGGVIPEYNYKKIYPKGYTKQSFYITMRDSVKLAVDLYLPKGLKQGDTIPTLLHQTRYWRMVEFRNFFKPIFGKRMLGKAGKLIAEIVPTGYAVVNIDTRGTGASFGKCYYPWHIDEIKDGAEIVNWIIKQPWSNRKVGSLGVSYSGTTSEMLLVNQHPAVRAIVPMFSLYDVYDDISFPNGVQLRYFTSKWGYANTMLDNNKLPTKKRLPKLLIKGVAHASKDKAVLKAAIESHKDNVSVADGVLTIQYRDDVPFNGKYLNSIDVFSPHFYKDKIDQSGAAIYTISGWYDGDYQHASIKRYSTLTNPKKKMMLGPWEHGGYVNLSPTVYKMGSFNKASELLKFFDYYLKGIETGITTEPPIYYYTQVEDKWKSSTVWPLSNTSFKPYYLADNKAINNSKNVNQTSITFTADTSVSSGSMTRWKSLLGKVVKANTYTDFMDMGLETMPLFDTPTLDKDIEVTGLAKVNLTFSIPDQDAAFFVYLTDVDEKGKVTYVTEGLMRASYAKPATGNAIAYKGADPYFTFNRADSVSIEPNKPATILFEMLPTSYLFKKGHKIRIILAMADSQHFTPVTKHKSPITIYFGGNNPSYIDLPEIPQ